MSAYKSSIFALLSKDNLAIPNYQRPYKWTKRNIEEFLTDISKAIEEGQKYGEYHWQQSRYNVSLGDTIYIYVSEDREIKYRMTVEAINVRYDQWMVKEEEFWVDKERINQDESEVKYALLRLEATSKSGKLTEENLTKHGFLRAPQGTKELDGELLIYIERRF